MTSVTLEEKRLKLLKQQLFGKEQPIRPETSHSKSDKASYAALIETRTGTSLIDPITMRGDLTKIVIFSSIALGIQLSLFFASKQGLIGLFR